MRKRLKPHNKFRAPLLRWHRRIGVTVAVLVIWLSVTGIVLNHSDQLQLDKATVEQSLLLSLYGIERPTPISFSSAGRWFSHLGGNHLYLDGEEVAYCANALAGVVWYRQQFVIACGDGLLLMSASGELIERIGSAYGVPEAISGLAMMADQLLLKTDVTVMSADLDTLQWRPYQPKTAVAWVVAAPVPDNLLSQLPLAGELNWERLLLDLHSGRLGSHLGRWLMDSAAVLLILLAVSGLWLWARRPSSMTRR